jgi:hypothetical protein
LNITVVLSGSPYLLAFNAAGFQVIGSLSVTDGNGVIGGLALLQPKQ